MRCLEHPWVEWEIGNPQELESMRRANLIWSTAWAALALGIVILIWVSA